MVRQLTAVVALAAFALVAQDRKRTPQARYDSERVGVSLPAALLTSETVARQLQSGLTTTFLIAVRHREMRRSGTARLEIRYDLWDDIYIGRRVLPGARPDEQRLTRAQLDPWWETSMAVLRPGRAGNMDIELKVLPFSAAEESDARQWLSKSGGVSTSDSQSGGIVDAMIGTTLNARPLASFRWTIPVTAEQP